MRAREAAAATSTMSATPPGTTPSSRCSATSFGDYFKDVAIELAWDLITKECGLPADRLLTTVYAEDDEAFELWKRSRAARSRILRIPTSDNFWAMGDTGPCGPCSEIFYDHGPEVPGGPPGSDDEDGDRCRDLEPRVHAVRADRARAAGAAAQTLDRHRHGARAHHRGAPGGARQYDIDLFRRIIEASELTGTSATGAHRPSHKVIADHLRACSFLIADGVMPHRTMGAATCCAGSCAARCATPTCWAPRSR